MRLPARLFFKRYTFGISPSHFPPISPFKTAFQFTDLIIMSLICTRMPAVPTPSTDGLHSYLISPIQAEHVGLAAPHRLLNSLG